jgi:hypothetical protein
MAKSPSLAAQTAGALTKPFNMPSVFGAPEPMKPKLIPPYITFAHHKRADEYKRIVDKFGIPEEHTMFLIEPDAITKLDIAKVSLLHYMQLWTMNDAKGEITSTSFKELPFPWKEVVEAVVLVYLEDRVVPANIQFRTTKCPAMVTLSKALVECMTPGWAELSPAHKETLAIQTPAFRFYGEVSIGPTRTSRSSGNTYKPTQCAIKPTGIHEGRLLEAFMADPNTEKRMTDAGARFQSQVTFFKSKEVK